MSTSTLIVTVLVVALGVLVFLKTRKPGEPRGGARKPAAASRPAAPAAAPAKRVKPPSEAIDKFRGAVIFPQKDACEAVMKLRGKTWPEGRVPKLPLPGCGRESCECQVHEIVGRRRGPRRISTDRRGDVRFKEDRRSGKDRRQGVDTWKQSID